MYADDGIPIRFMSFSIVSASDPRKTTLYTCDRAVRHYTKNDTHFPELGHIHEVVETMLEAEGVDDVHAYALPNIFYTAHSDMYWTTHFFHAPQHGISEVRISCPPCD